MFTIIQAKLNRHHATLAKGWSASMQDGLTEAIKRGGMFVHAQLGAGVELLLGTTQKHFEDGKTVFEMALRGTAALLLVIRVNGFA
jgi:hypothetical protein